MLELRTIVEETLGKTASLKKGCQKISATVNYVKVLSLLRSTLGYWRLGEICMTLKVNNPKEKLFRLFSRY